MDAIAHRLAWRVLAASVTPFRPANPFPAVNLAANIDY
jgi:hypothetical protein